MSKVVIVGAGISGLVAAYKFAAAGWEVVIYETRCHVGGNCHDSDVNGVLVSNYGPHLFHTNDDSVVSFLFEVVGESEFTAYEHRVSAYSNLLPDTPVPVPYNRRTEEMIGRALTDDEIIKYFFRDYSVKMWGIPFESLPTHIRTRVPCRRTDYDSRYFTDKYQFMPVHGYSTMFDAMLSGVPGENIYLGAHEDAWRGEPCDLVVYTGSIDQYHKYTYGVLPYRSLMFTTCVYSRSSDKDQTAVVNECNSKPYTRTTDYGLLGSLIFDDPDRGGRSTVKVQETPTEFDIKRNNVRYYPKRWGRSEETYQKYTELPTDVPTLFLGRLGMYRYMNMDEAIRVALSTVDEYV